MLSVRLAMTATITFCFPLLHYALRPAVHSFLNSFCGKIIQKFHERRPRLLDACETAAIIGTAVALAVGVGNVKKNIFIGTKLSFFFLRKKVVLIN